MPEIRRYRVTQVRTIEVGTPMGFEGQFDEEAAMKAAFSSDAGEWRTLNVDVRRADVLVPWEYGSVGAASTQAAPPLLTRTQDLPVTSQ